MTEFSFYLSEDDTNRLFEVKNLLGLRKLSGNDFARLVLEDELNRLFPPAPEYDPETGELSNGERFRRDRYRGRLEP